MYFPPKAVLPEKELIYERKKEKCCQLVRIQAEQ